MLQKLLNHLASSYHIYANIVYKCCFVFLFVFRFASEKLYLVVAQYKKNISDLPRTKT